MPELQYLETLIFPEALLYLVSFVSGKPNQKKQFTKLKTW